MGQRSIFETNYDESTIVIGTQSGTNTVVAGAAIEVNANDDEQAITLQTADWNASDTVAGGFVVYGLQHSDDTVSGNFVDVPNGELTTVATATSTVSGAQATGVFARVEKDDTATLVTTTYRGNKRYIRLVRTTQTAVTNGFAHCVSLVKGRLSTAPVGYKTNET